MANTTQPGKSAQDAGKGIMDKAKDAASTAADKARDAASVVADRARDLASQASQKADDLTARVGHGMESLGEQLRDRAPQGGTVGAVADRVAGGLESAGSYLSEEGLSGMADDLGHFVRRNPIPALFLGIGIGFLLARAMRS